MICIVVSLNCLFWKKKRKTKKNSSTNVNIFMVYDI